MDKYTLRGIIYSLISGLLLSYELMFTKPPRLFLIFMYAAVIVIGFVLIFQVHQTDANEKDG